MSFHYVYPDLAREYDVALVPFLLAGVAGDRTLNHPDLIHPNAAGAQRIAENVWPHLVPTLAPSLVEGSGGDAVPGGPGL
jgi:acyl-CoA thioesterase-1